MKKRKLNLLTVTLVSLLTAAASGQDAVRPCGGGRPNFVILLLDDSGWGDFHPFGHPLYETPHLQKLAEEGCAFNGFYVPQSLCSASRAALLTGCYPGRTKLFGALSPEDPPLSRDYALLSEVLKKGGYATAAFGKWHIGDQQDARPLARGFDEYSGLLYSNDMWKYHPTYRAFDEYPLQLWRNEEVVIEAMVPEDQKTLTKQSTEHAVQFIQKHKADPFFLYVPYSMPHVPLACSPEFEGRSGAGLYGDVIMELDWSVGQISKTLKECGLEENTVVVFASDNGPWALYGNHAGATPYRGAKATGFDGGIRCASVVKYPGVVPAGTVSGRAWCSVDIFPTLVSLSGVEGPENPVDGKDVIELWKAPCSSTPFHDYFPISVNRQLRGVISGDGRWKLVLPHESRIVAKPGADGMPGEYGSEQIGEALFDLTTDPQEQTNLIQTYSDIAEELKQFAEAHRQRFYEDR